MDLYLICLILGYLVLLLLRLNYVNNCHKAQNLDLMVNLFAGIIGLTLLVGIWKTLN